MRLSLFDLDHTLLDGDSDQLWCDWLVARGLLPRQPFAADSARLMRDYAAGRASAQRFSDFYIGTLAGRSAAQWADERQRWFASEVAPRPVRSAGCADSVNRPRPSLKNNRVPTPRALTSRSGSPSPSTSANVVPVEY